jgi:hypothetical protein
LPVGCESASKMSVENFDGFFGSVGSEAFASFFLRFGESLVA